MSLQDEIVEQGKGFRDISDFNELIEKIKDKKIVMLGEASHGTQEFYQWRRFLSKELLSRHGFNFIAVEGDWPACERLNQYIHRGSSQNVAQVMKGFSRWPTWMWANTEVMKLMADLRDINTKLQNEIGFHGLDVYSLYESIDETINKLRSIDSGLAARAEALYSCFDPFKHDEHAYAHSLYRKSKGCEEEVLLALSQILQSNLKNDHKYLDVIQNARIIKNAERYYRAMISFDEDSWNVRDRHMMETLDKLLEHYGSGSKAIIWAHNTHIGDYRATNMVNHGQINLGGLARQRYGEEDVALIGFTTFSGTVLASPHWDGSIELMPIPEAIAGSLEFTLHEAVPALQAQNFYLDFSSVRKNSHLFKVLGHRAIGVVYHPEHEHRGNYVPTIPAKRYDGLVFFDETNALNPLDIKFQKNKMPETYPFGDIL
jgi:erythromycin esterase